MLQDDFIAHTSGRSLGSVRWSAAGQLSLISHYIAGINMLSMLYIPQTTCLLATIEIAKHVRVPLDVF